MTRTGFGDCAELQRLDLLPTPIRIFDVDRHAMWWTNAAALAFWQAPSIAAPRRRRPGAGWGR